MARSAQVVAGLDYIAIGLVLFSLAVLTSMAKGGVLPWAIRDRKGKVSRPGLTRESNPGPDRIRKSGNNRPPRRLYWDRKHLTQPGRRVS